MVRLAIPADKAGAVYGKYDMQSEHGNILQQHVISALQECGIDRNNGDHSLLGKAARHRDGVSLCNADIEAALRIVGCKGIEAGPAQHGGCNGADARLLRAERVRSFR